MSPYQQLAQYILILGQKIDSAQQVKVGGIVLIDFQIRGMGSLAGAEA